MCFFSYSSFLSLPQLKNQLAQEQDLSAQKDSELAAASELAGLMEAQLFTLVQERGSSTNGLIISLIAAP